MESLLLKPIGYIRKQDGLEYAPVIVLYADKPAPENGAEPVEMYSRDQVDYLLLQQVTNVHGESIDYRAGWDNALSAIRENEATNRRLWSSAVERSFDEIGPLATVRLLADRERAITGEPTEQELASVIRNQGLVGWDIAGQIASYIVKWRIEVLRTASVPGEPVAD